MIKRVCAGLAIVGTLTFGLQLPAFGNPGPGNSFACAPGHQGNPAPGFKPASCSPNK